VRSFVRHNVYGCLLAALAALVVGASASAEPDANQGTQGVTSPALMALITNDDLFSTTNLTTVLDPAGTNATQHYGPYASESEDSAPAVTNGRTTPSNATSPSTTIQTAPSQSWSSSRTGVSSPPLLPAHNRTSALVPASPRVHLRARSRTASRAACMATSSSRCLLAPRRRRRIRPASLGVRRRNVRQPASSTPISNPATQ
jgi:hypothetical protein